MTRFCVFTPTYNRAHTLPRLYESLKRQSFGDFVWSIIDDGSTDDTEELIRSYMEDGLMSIRYVRTANGGKSRALNAAAEQSTEELFLCVDSDDWLDDEALAILDDVWKRCEHDSLLAGMIALRGKEDGSVMGTRMPTGIERTTSWDLYYKHHFKGDALQVYRTNIFKQFPAPVADGEKFMSESWTFNHIAQKYEVVLIDQICLWGSYLEDGLSRNVRKLTKDNPIGYYRSKAFDYEMSHSLYLKCYNSVLYMVGCMLAGKKDAIATAPNKGLAILSVIPAYILLKTVFR